jgi:hypothetical protein
MSALVANRSTVREQGHLAQVDTNLAYTLERGVDRVAARRHFRNLQRARAFIEDADVGESPADIDGDAQMLHGAFLLARPLAAATAGSGQADTGGCYGRARLQPSQQECRRGSSARNGRSCERCVSGRGHADQAPHQIFDVLGQGLDVVRAGRQTAARTHQDARQT